MGITRKLNKAIPFIEMEAGNDDLANVIEKRNKINNEKNLLLVKMSEASGDEKIKIGRKVNKLNTQLNELKKFTKARGQNITNCFRTIAGECLPKRVYSDVLHQANLLFKNPDYKGKLIDILTEKETEAINHYPDLEKENSALKSKIAAVKKVISEMMPNMIGVSDESEYQSRLKTIKDYQKILAVL